VWLTIACWLCAAAGGTAQPATSSAPEPGRSARLVVAPFVNLSQQTDDAWIGIGIAETVAADLLQSGAVSGVTVLAVTATAVGEQPTDDTALRAAAQQDGAVWLVHGGYQHVGTGLRITGRIVDVRTGGTVYTVQADGLLDELFDVQDELAAAFDTWLRGMPARAERVTPAGEGTAPAATRPDGSAGAATGVVELDRVAADVAPSAPRGGRGGFAANPVLERPTAVVVRATAAPRVDGRLDDAVWQSATHLTEFVQIAPLEGVPGTEETEVWMAYDDDHLYLAFYAHYTEPGMMRANRADRDEIRGDDRLSVLIDPFLDQQRAYQFEVNGYGVQADSIVNADGSTGASSGRTVRPQTTGGVRRAGASSGGGLSGSGQFGIRGDASWNSLFTTAGQLVDDGWTAEMAIPFKSLRYPAGAGDRRWGLQITRIIRGKSEAVVWSPVSRGVSGQLTQFGLLEGLSGLSTSRNLEILPQVTGVRLGSLNAESGEFTDRDPVGDVGVGVKYGITPNLTADLTYNPDFSQIESDQPQIDTNQRFPLFFPEQRPFFLEGQEIFATPTITNLLHTRTVIDPRFGAKLTGKLGRTTIGVVAADDEAAGRFDDRNDPRFGTTAQTFVGRARYDLYSESYLGTIVTAREFGHEYNRVGGVDGRFRFGRTHRVGFLAVASDTRSDLDGDEPLGGPVIEADYTRQGRNLGYAASYSSVDPDFRTGTGFLSRINYRQATANVSYRWWPESALITWGPTVEYLRLYNHDGVLQDEQLQGRVSMSFQRNISLNATVSRDLERFNEIDFRKNSYGLFGVISTQRVSLVGGFNQGDGVLFGDSPFLGRTTSGNFLLSARPTSRLRAELVGIFSQFVDPRDSTEVFDVKIFRTRATYQFTNRLLVRHILQYNTAAVTFGNNLLLTYRINSGTVAFIGYDDRFQQGSLIDEFQSTETALVRTNRAVFAKISYLFRY
jgi:TolB-like protein